MRPVNSASVAELHAKGENIRNICILAHVDHGKTTLADSLVASNGIISQRQAGKLRYMDSRRDEQERGITMKSSSIALCHETGDPPQKYLVNLIDSPGHVDFGWEVSAAVRLSDGAVVLVDVLEGVCAQTKVSLQQAYEQGLAPVLVFNKMDRLVLEKKLAPLDAHLHLSQLLEQVNVVLGELFTSEVAARTADSAPTPAPGEGLGAGPGVAGLASTHDWASGLEDADDSTLYFQPERGNVAFASAVDGWAFRLEHFSRLYAPRLGVEEADLRAALWGDFYVGGGKIKAGAAARAKKTLFTQLVLENLWQVYETLVERKDRSKLPTLCSVLGVTLSPREMRLVDGRAQLQALMQAWLPLSKAVLDMAVTCVPSPLSLSERRARLLLGFPDDSVALSTESHGLVTAFTECSPTESAPLVVFIAKMFPVPRSSLPENRPVGPSPEELQARRAAALTARRLRDAQVKGQTESDIKGDPKADEKASRPATCTTTDESIASESSNTTSPAEDNTATKPSVESSKSSSSTETVVRGADEDAEEGEDTFVAFARVFSGTLRAGTEVFVLGPKHDPKRATAALVEAGMTLRDLPAGRHVTRAIVKQVYLLMGADLEPLGHAPAGTIIGVGGLRLHVLKTATLSSTLSCPSFGELRAAVNPVVRVAVQPRNTSDAAALRRGLRLLNQADACVQVLVEASGETVLLTAGEVHLQRCLEDLRDRYAKVEIVSSEPIVAFRETVVPPPLVDQTNEAIPTPAPAAPVTDLIGPLGVRAVPLPPAVTSLLEASHEVLGALDAFLRGQHELQQDQHEQHEPEGEPVEATRLAQNTGDFEFAIELTKVKSTQILSNARGCLVTINRKSTESNDMSGMPLPLAAQLRAFLRTLRGTLAAAGGEWSADDVDAIWSFGPRRVGPNLLLNRVPGYRRPCFWVRGGSDRLRTGDGGVVNGFQLVALNGPLCGEPLMGVAFVVERWDADSIEPAGGASGQLMSAASEACRRALASQPQRLMVAMFNCVILVSSDLQGRVFGVLARRHGRVLDSALTEGSSSVRIDAVLPVAESFGFAAEVRKTCSGLASPQLVFSHWEVLADDPHWVPTTAEELLHFGDKADAGSRARRYVDAVRRRKGLHVDEQVVTHGEKQRTLSKNK